MIGHDITLARAGAASLEVLAALHGACFQPGWDAVEMARLLAMPGAYGLIATQDTLGPVGFLLGRAVAREAEIIALGVLGARRHRGIGGALLAEFILHMQEHGVSEAFLEVAVENAPALSLYRRHGFSVAGLRKAYYSSNGADAYVMRRQIS